jgi:hypothetical protein
VKVKVNAVAGVGGSARLTLVFQERKGENRGGTVLHRPPGFEQSSEFVKPQVKQET